MNHPPNLVKEVMAIVCMLLTAKTKVSRTVNPPNLFLWIGRDVHCLWLGARLERGQEDYG